MSLDAELQYRTLFSGDAALRKAADSSLTFAEWCWSAVIALNIGLAFIDAPRSATWATILTLQLAAWIQVRLTRRITNLLKVIQNMQASGAEPNGHARTPDKKP